MCGFHEAILEAQRAIADVAGLTIRYHRGEHWTSIDAVAGRTTFSADDGFGAVVETQSRDYLFEANKLRFNGQLTTPQRGDYITEDVRGVRERYDVARPDGGSQVFRFSDHGRTTIRVHTTAAPGDE